ncbi:MAG TPA: rod shape-determining protein RodA [Candidatus Omnitrophota bacterium]|nr:rod shape-determining protein RodA [Candidatus Omnitrophota bacterium]MDD4941054.1 rod shape-determining protein RodA [Candidatus Omnitrophota bacterium]HNQ51464.1 rod shape-determining protein RodA [Candidatus Omnitrophota bacterium]HQO38404.1 rod shape-determining protein RodA [Candidatus Omnitrophota bacterium]HQQ06490.1 rod shape-determining protein RodA [Candidatus Omnitrophota bacterium]
MRTDLKIPGIALLISMMGIVTIYSSTYMKEGEFWQSLYQRQILWVALGLVVYAIFSRINYRRIWDWTYAIYALVIILLLLVVGSGIVRLGAQRWLRIAWFNLQPSEVAKFAVLIYMARYCSKKSPDDVGLKARRYGIVKGLIIPFLFVIVPSAFIIEQPDLGSGALVFFLFFAMLYLGNVRLRYLALVAGILIAVMPVAWHFLHDYQRDRILVFLNPNIDPLGAGYTIIQSKIAIGSGGFLGKGWLGGTQSQLFFLPEAHTDFIFATFTEQWGFVGGIILLALYFLLIKQGINVAERTGDHYGRLLSLGISLMLAIQVCINISMNMGLAPVVGIPLPLMSYGGSSMIITYICLGMMANINRTRAVF